MSIVDPETAQTAIVTAASVTLTSNLLLKILGSTAEYCGGELKDFSKKRVDNLKRVFDRADKLLPPLEDGESVPPRVLKGILLEGQFCDDSLTAEYFGGVLASSRSKISRDDRACALIALLGQMSSYQIRAHYIIYSVLRRALSCMEGGPKNAPFFSSLGVWIPHASFALAMAFEKDEPLDSITAHIIDGLHGRNLMEQPSGLMTIGPIGHIPGQYSFPAGRAYLPSGLGIELFLWAHGHRNAITEAFFDPHLAFPSDLEIALPNDTEPVMVGKKF